MIGKKTRAGWLHSSLGYPLLGEIYMYIFLFFPTSSFTAFTMIFLLIFEIFQINRDPFIPEIQLFQNLIMKIQGKVHGWGQAISHIEYDILVNFGIPGFIFLSS